MTFEDNSEWEFFGNLSGSVPENSLSLKEALNGSCEKNKRDYAEKQSGYSFSLYRCMKNEFLYNDYNKRTFNVNYHHVSYCRLEGKTAKQKFDVQY